MGGIAKAVVGAPSSGGSGITQLTADVTAGPGSGSQAATLVATANVNSIIDTQVNAAAVGAPSIFTSNGTWTPSTTGQALFMARLVGGGSGGAPGSSTYGGGGGAGGEVVDVYLGHVTSAQTITIGTGGAANTAGNNTTIGSIATAKGASAPYQNNSAGSGVDPGTYDNPAMGNGGAGSSSGNGSGGYPGLFRLGSGGGGGGYLNSTGGKGGGPQGSAGGSGVAGAGGGGSAGDNGAAGTAGSGTIGGNGGIAAANSGSGGGGGGAGTTPGAGGAGGSGYVIIWQIA